VLVYPFTKNKADDIEKQIQEYVDIVVGEQVCNGFDRACILQMDGVTAA